MGGRVSIGVALAVAASIFLQGGSASAAAPPVGSFSMAPSSTQAGGHPDLNASVSIGSEAPHAVFFAPSEGVVAFPYSAVACSEADLALGECPPGSQVGVATFYAAYEGQASKLLGTAAVYAVAQAAGEYRELGARVPVLDAVVSGPVSLEYSSEGSAQEFAFEGFPESAPLRQMDLTLWGVPASPAHDANRFPKGTSGCPGLAGTGCIVVPTVSSLSQTPFLEAPTSCEAPAPPSYVLVEYGDGQFSFKEAPYPTTTGCDQLSFNPSVTLGPLPARAGAPAELDLKLEVPQTQSPVTPSPSEVEELSVDFQDALELDAMTGPGSHPECGDVVPPEGTPRCPEETRVGTVTLDGPLFPGEPITGGIYLGEISPPVRVMWVIASGYGVELEFPFLIEPAVTGPMKLDLLELPQFPLESIGLHFYGGKESLFKTGRCGNHTPVAEAVPWDEALAPQSMSLGERQWSEGTAGPCPYVPARVVVSLAPQLLPADGISTTTAKATVTDFYGLPLPDQAISFSSTDGGHRIGPVQGNGDGSYRAGIVASTVPGTSTITATDLTAVPPVSGQATLLQDQKAPLSVRGPGPTGRRAAALKRCKKKHRRKARARCRKRALKLPR